LNARRLLPRRLSFPKICDILVAYLNAGADKEFVGLGEVANRSNVQLHNISRNNNFLKSWGFIEENEKEPGKHRLTREAAEFASMYRIDPDGEETKQVLKEILIKDSMIVGFVERVEREKVARNALLVDLPRTIGDLRADKVGLNAFLDMLGYAFRVEELYSSVRTVTVAEKPKVLKHVREAKRKGSGASIPIPVPHASISITLSINPEISPERLKEYVKAVLKAYEESAREG